MDIILQNICKTYTKSGVDALKDISFEVPKGELFGLIGPDGAGKTSIFRILTTLLYPNSGKATVLGLDTQTHFKTIREKIGYMPGRFSLYQDLTVEENLNFFARLFNTTIAQNYELIKDIYIQIEPFKNRPAGKLSGGMKQKLALSCALIHRPEILFLDEPTTGVDAVSRKEFWHMLKRLKNEGITIMVSTPYMDEATLCERIALIQNGQILSIDSPEGIQRQYPFRLFAVKSSNMSGLLRFLRALKTVQSVFSFGEYHHVTFLNTNASVVDELKIDIKRAGFDQFEIKETTPGIEDCFIQLMPS